ncbi:hypothetical protein LOTGIDRAFT_115312, partial [Lottia gigantea]
NGFLSDSFYLERGCRQGDPLSPYIFILCAEILATLMRNSKDVKGVTIDNEENKLSQYANDTTFILDGSPESIKATLTILDFFAEISGLRINYSKTKAIRIGAKNFSQEVYHHDKWKQSWGSTNFDFLGFRFTLELDSISKINFDSVCNSINSLLNQWSIRYLTPIGKINVLKSLIIPKLTHLFISLPNPEPTLINLLNTKFFKFIWNNKPEKNNLTKMEV